MTNTKIRRIITKGVIMIAVLSMLIGGIVTHALTSVYSGAEGDAPNFSFDYSEVLTAPTAINTGDGTYYVPTAYVYYGRRYDSVNQKYVSLLHRVLDPSADNTGAGGAMFLLAENTAHSSRFSPYNDDTVAGYLDNENSYVTSTLRQKLYSGKYTVYEIAYVNTSSVDSLPQELDYIRPVTKTDTTENMNGYFGYAEGESSYIWGVVDKDGKPVDSLTILDGERVFPLSAEELYSYVGSASFSGSTAKKIFAASDVLDGTFDSWWLRTAFILAGGEENSDLVGIVDADGKVTYSSAQNTLPTRNALNIETSEIAFVERVADKTYRLAFNAPEYKEGEQFEAYITDVKDGRVTFTVKNHIGDSNWQHAGESRISYVITDSEGNEKYYGVAGTVRETASVGQKVSEEETFTFTLPGCYEVGDRVQVFSERVDDPERISTSYVSNFVDLGCIHIPAEGYEANCLHEAKCALCGIYYGSTDENNHRDVSNVWTYNEGEGTHSRECLNCSAKAYTEPCSFGRGNLNAPYACYESSCNGCGHKIDSPTLHNYDERGICLGTHGEYHYEMPKIENDANIGFIARVGTVGEWNALALWLNGGGYLHRLNETKYVIITEDLDFKDIPFIPMGTEELPVKRIDIRAQHKTFSNIEYTIEGAPAGIIAVGEDVAVDDLILEDSVFSGSDVGAVVGRLTDTAESLSDFSGIAVTGVELYGTNVGGIVGTLAAKASLSLSFIYDVTHNGINVDFSSDGKLIPTPASDNDGMPYGGCYRLAPEGDGEFAFTYEQFASGEVTYRLRQIDPYWKQTLGAHPHPVYCRDESVKRVYAVISCDSSDVIYSNEDLGKIQHGEYTSFVPSTFEWVDGVGEFGVGFKVNAVCGLCEKETEVILPAEWGVYYSFSGRFIARMEFNAYIEINGYRERVNTEPKVIYSTRLEDLIGMTPITVTYNGYNQYTDVLFGNLREGLDERDFDAYFLDPVTGERMVEMQYDYYGRPTYFPTGVKNVGTYDVLMVGKGGFEGYEYIYEDVFTIKKATVTVEPKDVDKIYDGNREFSAEYELLGDYVADLDLDISLENAPSEKVGAYILKVNADLTSHKHGDNIELTLLRDTVTALILPDLKIELSNRSYPEQITYGDPIPAVKDECFNVSADATLSYQWFTAGYNFYDGYFAQRAIDAPTDAGVYILRVQAMSKDGSLISNTLDLKFEVMKRSLTVDLYAPSGVEREEINYRTFYVLDPGEAFTYRISGFVGGDTAEALGLNLNIYLRAAEGGGSVEGDYNRNPSVPFKYGYQVEYNLPQNKNYEVGKYVIHNGTDTEESAYGVFYIFVRSPGYVYPVETDFTADGDAISPNILISVPIAGITPNGDEFDYIFRVFNAYGVEILEKVSSTDTLDLVYLYNHTVRESWSNGHTVTRGAFSAEGEYRVILQIEGEGMSATFETSFTLQFFNNYGEGVADMVEPGLYTVAVINEDGDTYEARLYAKQKLTMNLKPHEYSISEGRVEYDPT
ncbi:MAG: hypothetical protein IKD45_01250, partial [Clostridia bacterium]|nr:hypothetical protein [Clostridia bacterium]